MRQLSGLDAQFLALEGPRVHGHVAVLMLVDPTTAPSGRFDRGTLIDLVSARIHLLPPFRLRLAPVPFGLDHPWWVEDEEFDLRFHIRELAVAPPGTPHQLAEIVEDIASRPLDRARPLWEAHVIHGIEGGAVGLLAKMHHAAVDGMSGAEILSVLVDLSQEGRDVAPAESGPPEPVPGGTELLLRALRALPLQPWRALRALPAALPGLEHVAPLRALPGVARVSGLARGIAAAAAGQRDGGILERPSGPAPRTPYNRPLSPHRSFSYCTLPLAEVKRVKNAHGVTVNDVVVALATMAVRRQLAESGALPDRPLVALVPISVRTPEQFGTFGNRISTMLVTLPTDESDPRLVLDRVHETMRSAKEIHRALPASLLQDATQVIPPAVLARASRTLFRVAASQAVHPAANFVVSNVPGSPVPLWCGGARVLGTFPVSILFDGIGLNITVLSLQDSLDVGITADRGAGTDVWSLADYTSEALKELVGAVAGGG
ncbi:MAG: WS/DGAT/MGAT family O-acyltransferase [Mycobacteriales bacterium]